MLISHSIPIKSFVRKPEECDTAHVQTRKLHSHITWMNGSVWKAKHRISRSCASACKINKRLARIFKSALSVSNGFSFWTMRVAVFFTAYTFLLTKGNVKYFKSYVSLNCYFGNHLVGNHWASPPATDQILFLTIRGEAGVSALASYLWTRITTIFKRDYCHYEPLSSICNSNSQLRKNRTQRLCSDHAVNNWLRLNQNKSGI